MGFWGGPRVEGGLKDVFVHHYLWKWSILTNSVHLDWNHQLDPEICIIWFPNSYGKLFSIYTLLSEVLIQYNIVYIYIYSVSWRSMFTIIYIFRTIYIDVDKILRTWTYDLTIHDGIMDEQVLRSSQSRLLDCTDPPPNQRRDLIPRNLSVAFPWGWTQQIFWLPKLKQFQ